MSNRVTRERRTKLACDACRAKKRKCDGEKPKCGTCVKNWIADCRYSHHEDKRRPFSKNYVESLKSHIKSLESTLAKTKRKGQFIHPTHISAEERRPTVHSDDELPQPNNESNDDKATVKIVHGIERGLGEPEKLENLGNVLSEVYDSPDGVDFDHHSEANESDDNSSAINIRQLIDCYGKFRTVKVGNYRYYGPRSTISFLRNEGQGTGVDGTAEIGTTPDAPLLDTVECEYPSDKEMELYDLYFSFQNYTLTFLWKDLFYQQLKLPKFRRNHTFISESLQNAILAVGSIFDHADKESHSKGDRYAKTASLLLQKEYAAPSIPTAQACGILAIFYTFMNRDALSWHFSGAAISAAYSLGLNMDDNMINRSEHYFSEEEAELRRITFWAIYTLERVLNNMLGRPTFLKPESIISMVPSGLGVPEYDLWSNPYDPVDPNSEKKVFTRSFSSLTYTIELFITTSKPLDHIYLSFKPSIPSELELIVNKANTELLQFESALPDYLRIHYILALKHRETISPGVFVFQMRFQYVQILLHRVFFIRDIDQAYEGNQSVMFPHKKLCYESSLNICKLTSQYGKCFGLRNIDFSCPDIICSASIILLYLIKNPILNFDNPQTQEKYSETIIRKSCTKGFYTLRRSLHEIVESNLWARKSIYVLKQLIVDWGLEKVLPERSLDES